MAGSINSREKVKHILGLAKGHSYLVAIERITDLVEESKGDEAGDLCGVTDGQLGGRAGEECGQLSGDLLRGDQVHGTLLGGSHADEHAHGDELVALECNIIRLYSYCILAIREVVTDNLP